MISDYFKLTVLSFLDKTVTSNRLTYFFDFDFYLDSATSTCTRTEIYGVISISTQVPMTTTMTASVETTKPLFNVKKIQIRWGPGFMPSIIISYRANPVIDQREEL